MNLTASEISIATHGLLYGDKNIICKGVSIDSRKIYDNVMFVAIKGENFDGNEYVESALLSGASIAITNKSIDALDGKAIIVVSDTREALLNLASYWRDKFPIHIVGVTGSVGKTTTKEMIYHALSASLCTHKTQGNLNNDIGLPLTLLKLDETHKAAVIEMGMSAPLEISRLTKAAKPTIAVITNIGLSHIEHLKTRENILKAKLEIIEGLSEGGTLILNGDDPYLANVSDLGVKTIYYGIKNNMCEIKGTLKGADTFEVFGKEVKLPICGIHNIYNALAAIAVAKTCGLDIDTSIKGIMNFETDGIRQSIKETEKGFSVICDYYNANPQSVSAALSTLCAGEANRRIAVLGDMLELGDYAVSSHKEIGKKAVKMGVDLLVAVGEMSKHTVDAAKESGIPSLWFISKEEAADFLKSTLKRGDRVLIKGSRGMKMEEIYERITG